MLMIYLTERHCAEAKTFGCVPKHSFAGFDAIFVANGSLGTLDSRLAKALDDINMVQCAWRSCKIILYFHLWSCISRAYCAMVRLLLSKIWLSYQSNFAVRRTLQKNFGVSLAVFTTFIILWTITSYHHHHHHHHNDKARFVKSLKSKFLKNEDNQYIIFIN